MHPGGHAYSHFCDLYRAWNGRLSPTMRQVHVAGEKLFVDYAGTTLSIVDGATGEVLTCQLFVAALGASSYTYAEATMTQNLSDWIGSHARAFAHLGGGAADVGQPQVGHHQGVLLRGCGQPHLCRLPRITARRVLPARPYKSRDKAKVEAAVLLATRWIIAKLRRWARRFSHDFSTSARQFFKPYTERLLIKNPGALHILNINFEPDDGIGFHGASPLENVNVKRFSKQ